MKYLAAIAFVVGVVAASPSYPPPPPPPVNLCAGTTGTAKCCATDVLGLANLNCVTPPGYPYNTREFRKSCASIGQQAKCCSIGLLGQGLICNNPL